MNKIMMIILLYGISVCISVLNIYNNSLNYINTSNFSYLKAIEIVKNLYYVSGYYDERFKAIRLIFYQSVKELHIVNIICKIYYLFTVDDCSIVVMQNLSEEHTVVNMLVSVKYIPLKLKIYNYFIPLNRIFKKHKKEKNKLTVCIGKMINYTAYNMLIQTIEAYRFFGVNRFVIYKTSCSDKVNKVLHYYNKIGIMEIVKWENNFDIIYARNKTYGQRIKLNDCLYRNYYTSDSIIMTDLDEILWPNHHNSIIEMINDIEKLNIIYDVYLFQERIFKRNYVEYNDRYVHNINDCDIFTYHTFCDYTWKWPKLLIRNLTKITSVSIHWITSHLKNYTQRKIDNSIGFIRHTRRLYPYIVKGLTSNCTYSTFDRREFIITNNALNIKKLIFKN